MIAPSEYLNRRQQLLKAIGKEGIAIIAASSPVLRNGDVHYRYRQNSDFYYLTGFNEPNAIAVLMPNGEHGEFILFNQPRDPKEELWVGKRAGQEGACQIYGADHAFPIDEIDEELPKLLQDRKQVHYAIGRCASFDARLMRWVAKVRAKVRSGINAPEDFVNIEHLLHEMRLQKSETEIALMRQVAHLSAEAHCRAMQACQPDIYEYELAAHLMYEFYRQACHDTAYDPIVASHDNACILHYVENNRQCRAGELVLIDAGAELQGYAADITRTFPVSGIFSAEQTAIYEIVLQAQQVVIDSIKPGLHWNKMQEKAIRVITEGLVDLNILKGNVEKLIENKAYSEFYMHNIGHWLGLDVHDAGHYKVNGHWRELKPGMVFTVEPGIYIRPSDTLDKRWWNIGVRIEDDILVTKEGCEILSVAAPKKISEIEALMLS